MDHHDGNALGDMVSPELQADLEAERVGPGDRYQRLFDRPPAAVFEVLSRSMAAGLIIIRYVDGEGAAELLARLGYGAHVEVRLVGEAGDDASATEAGIESGWT